MGVYFNAINPSQAIFEYIHEGFEFWAYAGIIHPFEDVGIVNSFIYVFLGYLHVMSISDPSKILICKILVERKHLAALRQ